MNVTRLIERIIRTVQDESYSSSDILEYVNEGLLTVSGLFALPALESTAVIETDPNAKQVPLPDDFHNHLRFVYSSNRRRSIRIYSNLVRLREEHPLRLAGGFVRAVAVSAGNLFYEPSPASAEELDLIFHAKPDEYTINDNEPDYIPDHLSFRLLHAYCCFKIFDEIEDGVDGQKPGVMTWEQRYQSVLGELSMFLGAFYTRPVGEMGSFDMVRL